MSSKKRRTHSPVLKAKVALTVVSGNRIVTELAEQFQVHPNLIRSWKRQLLDGISEIFRKGLGQSTDQSATIKKLHAKIDQLVMEKNSLIQRARGYGMSERKAMINKSDKVPVTTQCRLLGLNRSTVYYQAKTESEQNLELMRLIDQVHQEYPFCGSRRIS